MGKAQTKENWIIMGKEISWNEFGRSLRENKMTLREVGVLTRLYNLQSHREDIYSGWFGKRVVSDTVRFAEHGPAEAYRTEDGKIAFRRKGYLN